VQEQRHLYQLLVHGVAVRHKAVLEEALSVIRENNDQRVFQKSLLLEGP
jgi:hypothetical protein